MRRGFLYLVFVVAGVLGVMPSLRAEGRAEHLLEKGWRFTRADNPTFKEVSCADADWQNVTVPHDWAIYGPFSAQNDKQEVAIAQDGQTEAMEHAGRTGGLPFVGVGWYRLDFEVPEFSAGKRVALRWGDESCACLCEWRGGGLLALWL